MSEDHLTAEMFSTLLAAGVEIRHLPLSAEQPGARSGLVMLRGKPTLFLDSHLRPEERRELLARALARLDLENVYLSPAVRALVEKQSPGRKG